MGDVKRSEVTVTSETSNLALIYAELEGLLGEIPVSRDWLSEVMISVDEAFSNIIEHGYGRRPGGEIRVTLAVDRDSLSITFRDDAAAYTPPQTAPVLGSAILERKTPGLGWYFMRHFMDGVDYKRIGEFNWLTLTKKINPEEHHDAQDKRCG